MSKTLFTCFILSSARDIVPPLVLLQNMIILVCTVDRYIHKHYNNLVCNYIIHQLKHHSCLAMYLKIRLVLVRDYTKENAKPSFT